ncbi:MAG: inorganic phosphate transporter [Brumimicrobium sp.]
MIYILVAAALFLAYSNGSNDIFKSVATLFGSKTSSYRNALNWATITSLLGSITAIFLMSKIVSNFSGSGLVPEFIAQTPAFATSIALTAATTVFIATKIGMPISTTHGLIGAISGAGILAVGSAFNFSTFGSTLVLPLVLSPLLAAVFSPLLYKVFSGFRKKLKINRTTCICIGKEVIPVTQYKSDCNCTTIESNSTLRIDELENCREVYQGRFIGVDSDKFVNFSHYLSAGFVGFSRSLNDTQKMVGFLLIANVVNVTWGMLFIGIIMALGGLLNSRKVAETMSNKITQMNQGQGFSANIVTGGLVSVASVFGLPVSTTHVAVGSIFGVGLVTKESNLSMIKKILYSWLLTLPIAFGFGALFYWFLSNVSLF